MPIVIHALDNLLEALADVLAWQHLMGQSRPVARSSALADSANAVFPQSCWSQAGAEMERHFHAFTEARRQRVGAMLHFQAQRRQERHPPRPLAGSRSDGILADVTRVQESFRQAAHSRVMEPRALLLTDWRASLHDGALEPPTDGFFDSNGMPGWDVWLGLVSVPDSVGQLCLLSWIPSELREQVDDAVQIDAAESLAWCVAESPSKLVLLPWGQRWAASSRAVERTPGPA